MKKLKFLKNVSDKYTNEKYEEGQIKEFNNQRAEEILKTKKAVLVEELVETATKKEKTEIAAKKTRKKTE